MTALEKKAKQYASEILGAFEKDDFPVGIIGGTLRSQDLLMRAFMDGAMSVESKGEPPSKYANAVDVILSHLNNATGRGFRSSKANSKIITARLKESGVTVDGIKKMIDRQVEKWRDTEFEEYLQPSTLFRPTKFDSYYSARDLPAKMGQSKGHLIYE